MTTPDVILCQCQLSAPKCTLPQKCPKGALCELPCLSWRTGLSAPTSLNRDARGEEIVIRIAQLLRQGAARSTLLEEELTVSLCTSHGQAVKATGDSRRRDQLAFLEGHDDVEWRGVQDFGSAAQGRGSEPAIGRLIEVMTRAQQLGVWFAPATASGRWFSSMAEALKHLAASSIVTHLGGGV